MTVGRPVQIFALAALLLVLAGGGVLMLHRSPSSESVQAPAKPAAARATRPAPAAPTKHAAPVAAAPKAEVPKAAAPKPAAPRLVAANGLPMPLAKALRKHRIVVVSLFDPESRTDAISFAEARAGARAAGAGFLGVSVLNNDVAGPLTSALPGGGLLPSPGVLVYRRPDSLVVRLDGFADRDAVAQAAAGAVTAPAETRP